MKDHEIRYAMLLALRAEDLEEGRRLQKLRHELIDRETVEQHKMIDSSFVRLWKAEPK